MLTAHRLCRPCVTQRPAPCFRSRLGSLGTLVALQLLGCDAQRFDSSDNAEQPRSEDPTSREAVTVSEDPTSTSDMVVSSSAGQSSLSTAFSGREIETSASSADASTSEPDSLTAPTSSAGSQSATSSTDASRLPNPTIPVVSETTSTDTWAVSQPELDAALSVGPDTAADAGVSSAPDPTLPDASLPDAMTTESRATSSGTLDTSLPSETSATESASLPPASSSIDMPSSVPVSTEPRVCEVTRTLHGIVRDFPEDHPDMEPCDEPNVACSSEKGLVQVDLGADGKPVFTTAERREQSTVYSIDTFNQWFNDVPEVNSSTPFDLQITVQRYRDPMKRGYDSSDPPDGSPAGFGVDPKGFFPIDELNTTPRPHNYSFTYEVATSIEYTGGEELTVRGDDDIFVYLNRKLVIDLGGIHLPEEATVDFDEVASSLGMEPGNVYELHLFFAERHVEQSNLFISTTARFMECTGG